MKNLLRIIAFVILCQSSYGQEVKEADSVAPEDLGAYKWILRGTAKGNKVVIFRMTTIRDWGDKVTTQIHDTVQYYPGKALEGTAFFIDPQYFDPDKSNEPNWHFRALGSTGWIAGRYAGHSYGDDKATINFESKKWGKTRKEFETFIITYEKAKASYKDLPEIDGTGGWTWAGFPIEKSKQSAALKAGKPLE